MRVSEKKAPPTHARLLAESLEAHPYPLSASSCAAIARHVEAELSSYFPRRKVWARVFCSKTGRNLRIAASMGNGSELAKLGFGFGHVYTDDDDREFYLGEALAGLGFIPDTVTSTRPLDSMDPCVVDGSVVATIRAPDGTETAIPKGSKLHFSFVTVVRHVVPF